MSISKWLTLCIAGVLVVGFTSGIATAAGMRGWYDLINKPWFNPPSWIFGPVWTVLYIMMGVGLYLILQTPKGDVRTLSLIIFGIQLLLNFMWSFIFFYFHEPFIALVEIIVLWIAILAMITWFRKISPVAAYLQIPYLLWVSFATILNASLWYLNT